jgi:hypothetical protein
MNNIADINLFFIRLYIHGDLVYISRSESVKHNSLCASHDISRHKTVPGTPQQNGVAERMNRTIVERVHCMLSNSGLWDTHGLWVVLVWTTFSSKRGLYSRDIKIVSYDG